MRIAICQLMTMAVPCLAQPRAEALRKMEQAMEPMPKLVNLHYWKELAERGWVVVAPGASRARRRLAQQWHGPPQFRDPPGRG